VELSRFTVAKEQRETAVNTSTDNHFEIIFDNGGCSRLFVPFSHDTLHIGAQKQVFHTDLYLFDVLSP
jgi:hypothetical protein